MRGWSRRGALVGLGGSWLGVWVGGCPRRRFPPVDPDLPDGEPPEEGGPRDVLEALSTHPVPEARAHALAALVRGHPASSALRWITQGLYDPDPWVQGRVALALLDRADALGSSQLEEAFTRRATDATAVGAAMHAMLDLGHQPSSGVLRSVWGEQRPWDAAPRALVAWRAGIPEAGRVVAAGLGSGLVRWDPSFTARVAAHGDRAWAADVRRGWQQVEETEGACRTVLAAWGQAASLRWWRAQVRALDPLAAQEVVDPWFALPVSLADDLWPEVGRARTVGVRRAVAAARRPRLSTLRRALDPELSYPGQVVWRALAPLSGAERRAAVALGLGHPDARVQEEAAVAVQRWRLSGLEALLEPSAAHRLASVRAAVAGARWISGPSRGGAP